MTENTLLKNINSPAQLKTLPVGQIPTLCSEIRDTLVSQVNAQGGHLSSNLGVVELTVALHRIFNSPQDKILWDVGHQSYVHKLLTGRYDRFSTLRAPGGLSAFCQPAESEHDHFISGHSSNSISAALGFAEANRIEGREDFVIAVAGDGAFTGGLIHEALNNCRPELRLVIILNDNDMSISHNVGGFAKYISRIRTTRKYHHAKRVAGRAMKAIPFMGKWVFSRAQLHKRQLKGLVYPGNYFEQMGISYLGPVDGHDVKRLEVLFEEARNLGQCCLIHVRTTKGKGYAPAEDDPGKFHGVSADPARRGETFSYRAGQSLLLRAKEDKKICAITAAMSDGCGLNAFREALPERFFDVGIAEGHAATFAAGLAAAGMKPTFAVYSTFLQRSYDNVIHDMALGGLPVVVCIDRAGINIADGATHHGIFDVAMLSHIPGVEIYAPLDFDGLEACLDAAFAAGKPAFVRYHSGGEVVRVEGFTPLTSDPFVRVCDDFGGADASHAIITYGKITAEALRAAVMLHAEGKSCRVVALERLKPYNLTAKSVAPLVQSAEKIVFLEEGIANGGAGACLFEELRKIGVLAGKKWHTLAIHDHFAVPVAGEHPYATCGISVEDVVRAMTREFATQND